MCHNNNKKISKFIFKRSDFQLSLFFFLLNFVFSSGGQQPVFFSNANAELNFQWNTGPHYAGTGVSTFDYNEDGWDDLTLCISGSATLLFTNNSGQLELTNSFTNDLETKQCLWFDLEEDGDNDLFITRRNGAPQLWRQNSGGDFTLVALPFSAYYYQNINMWGATLGDVNQDGFLDIFIACGGGVTDSKNIFLLNNQQGNFFEPQPGEAFYDFTGSVKSSFQPVFVDLNRDNEQDLFITNDYFQGNEFFEKNDLVDFQDKSIESGLFIPGNSMSNSWSDYDGDGDMDCFITNIGVNHLMENSGEGQFIDVSVQKGVDMNFWNWAALWIDFENDGDEDLISMGRSLVDPADYDYFFFKNEGGLFFAQSILSMGLFHPSFVASKFDFDRDGKSDIIIIPDSFQPIKIFKNLYASGNSVNLTFKGRVSNRNAVGTRFLTWVNGNKKEHYISSGQDYLTQYSQHINVGIGSAQQIDSVQIFWLSGLEETYYNIQQGERREFIEGLSFGEVLTSQPAICAEGDQFTLTVSEKWPYSIWQNGQLSHTITADHSGTYEVTVFTGKGHPFTMSVNMPLADTPQVEFEVSPIVCSGDHNGSIEAHAYFQDTVIVDLINSQLTSGIYPVLYFYNQGYCVVQDTVQLIDPDPMFFSGQDSILVCSGGLAVLELTVSGGEGPYYWTGDILGDSIQVGIYPFSVIDTRGCIIQDTIVIQEFPEASIYTQSNHTTCENLSDGEIILFPDSVFEPAISEVYPKILDSLMAGEHIGTEWDKHGCPHQWSAFIDEGDFFSGQLSVIDSITICDSSEVLMTDDWITFLGENGQVEIQTQQGNELIPGEQTVLIAHSNGCTLDTSIAVFVSPIDLLELEQQSLNNQTVLMLNNIEGVENPIISWSNGQTSPSLNVDASGYFEVMVTDDFGCVWSDSIWIEVNQIEQLANIQYFQIINRQLTNISNQILSNINVYNSLGQKIGYIQEFRPGSTWDTSRLNGLCILTVNNQIISKIILQ